MLIYFDESYDNNHEYLLLGALFNPHPKYLQSAIKRIKDDAGFYFEDGRPKEIKYSACHTHTRHRIACSTIDAFMTSTSWFRCIVVEESLLNYDLFGNLNEPASLKKARAYKKFTELLLCHNVRDVKNGVLLVDELKRCRGDRFIEVMKDEFCTPGQNHSRGSSTPTLKEILPVRSHLEQYHTLQVCDLMLGCVLNNLKPTQNVYKNRTREHLVSAIGVPTLEKSFWGKYSKKHVESTFPKFNVWYWHPSVRGKEKT